jgi:hypothetical protein
VFFPFDHICYSPQFFDEHSIRICNNSLRANTEGLDEEFMEEVYKYEEQDLRAFAALDTVCQNNGIEVVLLIDELLDLSVFKSFPGYKYIIQEFISRYLLAGRMKCVATTAFIRKLRQEFEGIDRHSGEIRPVPPLTMEEIAHLICQRGMTDYVEVAREIAIITRGNQGYVKALLDHALKASATVDLNTIVSSFLPDGPLEVKCRFNYEYLVAKSRGEGIIRHLLAVISAMERPNLTEIARKMKRSLGVTKDYLKWMMAVGLLDTEKKRYWIPDELLRLWISLYRSGSRPSRNQVAEALSDMLNDGYRNAEYTTEIDYEAIKQEYETGEDEIKLPGF